MQDLITNKLENEFTDRQMLLPWYGYCSSGKLLQGASMNGIFIGLMFDALYSLPIYQRIGFCP